MDTLIGSVPNTWQTQLLSNCCEVKPGPSGSILKSAGRAICGTPVVTAADIQDYRIASVPEVNTNPRSAKLLDNYLIKAGDILIVRVGDTTRHALVAPEQGGWFYGGSCIRIRPSKVITSEYLSCYLMHPAVQEWLAHQTRQGIVPTLTAKTVAKLPLVFPPVDAQKKVVEVVRAIDDKIRVHEEIAQASRGLRKILLPQLLSGELVPGIG